MGLQKDDKERAIFRRKNAAVLGMTVKNMRVLSNWIYIADFVARLHKTCAFTVYFKAWRSLAVKKYSFLSCILRGLVAKLMRFHAVF